MFIYIYFPPSAYMVITAECVGGETEASTSFHALLLLHLYWVIRFFYCSTVFWLVRANEVSDWFFSGNFPAFSFLYSDRLLPDSVTNFVYKVLKSERIQVSRQANAASKVPCQSCHHTSSSSLSLGVPAFPSIYLGNPYQISTFAERSMHRLICCTKLARTISSKPRGIPHLSL